METIDDKVLQEGAIKDILHYEQYKHTDDPYPPMAITHQIEVLSTALTSYIKRKFEITDQMVASYVKDNKDQLELDFGEPIRFNKYWSPK